jgi:hypothetical protein
MRNNTKHSFQSSKNKPNMTTQPQLVMTSLPGADNLRHSLSSAPSGQSGIPSHRRAMSMHMPRSQRNWLEPQISPAVASVWVSQKQPQNINYMYCYTAITCTNFTLTLQTYAVGQLRKLLVPEVFVFLLVSTSDQNSVQVIC